MTRSHVNLADAGPILRDLIAAIVDNTATLSELDGATGDGDHGINMSKGFRLAGTRLGQPEPPLPEALSVLSETLLGDIGGSMGPIYGTFFAEMAAVVEGRPDLDAQGFSAMLRAGVEAVQDLGGAKPGDKTLIDVLVPAADAYDAALSRAQPFAACLDAMTTAAGEGYEATRDMVARIGRAARLGERSRGTHDAGAASCRLLLQALADGFKRRLEGSPEPS